MAQRDWTIRPGARADRSPVLDLWRAAESLPSATDSEAGLERLLSRDPDCLLVAEADEEIVGSLIAGWDGWRGSFYRLAAHPAWQRQGIATALVRAGEERLRQLGAVRLTAIVSDRERAALKLWRAVGYERQAERSRFVRMILSEDRC